MNMVVILELSEGKEIGPVILSLVDKKSEVLLQLLVHPFGLAISLWMIGSGGCEFDA